MPPRAATDAATHFYRCRRVRSHFECLWPTQGADGIDALVAEAAELRKRIEEAKEEAARERLAAEQQAREKVIVEERRKEREEIERGAQAEREREEALAKVRGRGPEGSSKR